MTAGMLLTVKPFRVAPDRFGQEDWRGQFARVQRWQQRALRVVESGEQQPDDYLHALCQNAYHLRDWLQTSGAASQRYLDQSTSSSTRGGLSTDHIGLMREYVLPPVTSGEPGERLRLQAVEAARSKLGSWERWRDRYGLHRAAPEDARGGLPGDAFGDPWRTRPRDGVGRRRF